MPTTWDGCPWIDPAEHAEHESDINSSIEGTFEVLYQDDANITQDVNITKLHKNE